MAQPSEQFQGDMSRNEVEIDLNKFMAMVSEYDFQDQDQKKATLELLEKQWSKIVGTNLERTFQSAYDLAKTRLQDSGFYSPSAGTPAAKIISLSLLDNI